MERKELKVYECVHIGDEWYNVYDKEYADSVMDTMEANIKSLESANEYLESKNSELIEGNYTMIARIKELEANEQAMNDAHCKLMDKLDAAKPTWVSVKDRMPEEGEDVLYTNGEVICLGSWGVEYGDSDHSDEEHAYWCDEWGHNDYEMDEVTHWMPLPTPPKEGSNGTQRADKT